MSKKIKKNVPVLRFPEFEGDWQPQQLKNILIESNIQASEELPLYSLTIESGIVPKTERYERSFLVKNEEEAYKVVQPNDFAYNPMNLRFGALSRHTEPKNVKVSKYYNIFSVNLKANVIFVDYLLTKSSSIKFYDSIAMGSLVEKKRVHFCNFLKSKFLLPSIAEQEKIASFLGAIDSRLTQLRRKQKLLQTYKRGVMQKIFSQELRFKDATGLDFPNWKNSNLSDIANIVGGGTPDTHQEEYWGGHIQWFTPTELKTKYISKSVRTITCLGLKNSSAKILPVGTLLFSSRATVGDVSINLEECATNQGFQSFIVNTQSTSEFLYYWVVQNKKIFLVRASGSTFLEISKQEISKITIYLPCFEEQKTIVIFLTAIDKKIEAVAQQIDRTEQFKKGLLQKMFV